jgi:hypothetical protein
MDIIQNFGLIPYRRFNKLLILNKIIKYIIGINIAYQKMINPFNGARMREENFLGIDKQYIFL